MRIIFVRHGESEGNAARGYDIVDSPLTALGREQAEKVAKHFAHTHVDAIYSSTLLRAHQTALAIAKPHHLPVTQDPRIVEVDYGNLNLTSSKNQGTVGLVELAQKQGIDPFTYDVHGGESLERALERAKPFLAEIIAKHRGKTIIVTAHGGIIRMVLLHLLQLPRADVVKLGHGNTAYSILDVQEDGSWKAHVIGEKKHLE